MDRLRIDLLLDEQERSRLLAEDVRRCLTARPKTLPPKYFYDAAGSDLFERITELPEYYLTRAEAGLLHSTTSAVMSIIRPREIVELGAGSATKTRLLLDAACAAGALARYLPFDVSSDALRSAGAALTERYPLLELHGIVGDFERHLDQIPPPDGRRLALLLGSTIGNLEPAFRDDLPVAGPWAAGTGGRLSAGRGPGEGRCRPARRLQRQRRGYCGLQPQRTARGQPGARRGLPAPGLPAPRLLQPRGFPHRDAPRTPRGPGGADCGPFPLRRGQTGREHLDGEFLQVHPGFHGGHPGRGGLRIWGSGTRTPDAKSGWR